MLKGFRVRLTANATSRVPVQVRMKSLSDSAVNNFADEGLRNFGSALAAVERVADDGGFFVGEFVLDSTIRTQEIEATKEQLRRYTSTSGNLMDRVYEVSFLVAPHQLWSGEIEFSMMALQENHRSLAGFRPEEMYHQATWWGWDGGIQKAGGQLAYIEGNAILWGNDGWLGDSIEISVVGSNKTVDAGVYHMPTTMYVSERAGTVDVEITRSPAASSESNTIYYETRSQSATPGRADYIRGTADYVEISGSATFAAGQTSATIQLQILDDDEWESVGNPVPESFVLVLLGGCDGAALGQSLATTIYIEEDLDDGQYGTVGFTNNQLTTNETARTVSVEVERTGGFDGVMIVNFTTEDETAFAGVDYIAAAGTLTFAPAQTRQSIEIAILNDFACEREDELFAVRLTVLQNPAEVVSLSDRCSIIVAASSDTEILRKEEGYIRISHPEKAAAYETFGFTYAKAPAQLIDLEKPLSTIILTARSDSATSLKLRREGSVESYTMLLSADFQRATFDVLDGSTYRAFETFLFQANPGFAWSGGTIDILTFELLSATQRFTWIDDVNWWFPPAWVPMQSSVPPPPQIPAVMWQISGIPYEVQARIADGSSRGVLELNFDNRGWDAVCDDGFGNREAAAFCAYLGFEGGTATQYDATHGDNDFAADDIRCGGNGPPSLSSCTMSQTPYTDNCADTETVGLECGGTLPPPPPAPSSSIVQFVRTSDGSAGIAEFAEHSLAVSENNERVEIVLTRSSNLGTATVHYSMRNGSAISPGDFVSQSGFVDFPYRQRRTSFFVEIVDDQEYESGPEQFSIVLDGACDGTVLGSRTMLLVNISGPSDVNPGQILLPPSQTVSLLTDQTVTLEVQRTDGADGTLLVEWESSNPTAISPNRGLLRFLDSERTKNLTVSLVDLGSTFADEAFTIMIVGVSPGIAAYEWNASMTTISLLSFPRPARARVSLSADIAEVAHGSIA
eukprot:SAG31_NODE_587_length_13828_cov_2.438779_6_plen_968_part_00